MRQVRKVTNIYNIGTIDAVLRMAIGVFLLLPLLTQDSAIWHIGDVAALLSIYPITTALNRCDPIYEILGIGTYNTESKHEKYIRQFIEISKSYLLGSRDETKAKVKSSNSDVSDKLRAA